jgi:hypothetical protein
MKPPDSELEIVGKAKEFAATVAMTGPRGPGALEHMR